MRISIMKIKRSWDGLIFIMGIPILVRRHLSWWRYQMETFSALLAICAGNSPVPGEFPAHRPMTQSFDVFFDLRLNKRLSKQSRGWWFETLSRPLWRHSNVYWDGPLVACATRSFMYMLTTGYYQIKMHSKTNTTIIGKPESKWQNQSTRFVHVFSRQHMVRRQYVRARRLFFP